MAKINLKFGKKLEKYGALDFNACYNCGTCTAICSLSNEEDSFPREMVRYSILGLNNEIRHSLKPWLCYYCGECTTHCPMEAKPGELMMSLRRYLISVYDWTGISGLLYRNLFVHIISFLMVIAGIAGLFVSGIFSNEEWLHYGHYFEMFAVIGVFGLILLPNIVRMWYYTVWTNSEKKLSVKNYLQSLSELVVHMFVQKNTLTCEDSRENKIWWLEHLLLVISYLSLLVTTVFLNWFTTRYTIVIIMGYLFSILIFIITTDFIIRRLRRRTEKSTFSHPSDWLFVIWMSLLGISTFAVRLLIDLNILETNFLIYLVHLVILVQWALILVPFGKWTHFLYRSFAMYFEKIRLSSIKAA